MLINIDTLIIKLEERSQYATSDPYSNTPEIDFAIADSLAILANIFTELKQESLNEERPI